MCTLNYLTVELMDLETPSILPLTKNKGSNNLKNIIIKCEKYFPFFTFKKKLNKKI